MPESQSPTLNGGTNNFAAGSGTQNNNNGSGTQNNNHYVFHGSVNVHTSEALGSYVSPNESKYERAGSSKTKDAFNPILYEHGQGMAPEETELMSALIDEHLSENNDSPFWWIDAPVGCGKTAMALTLVEREEHVASFIRGRGDDKDPAKIVDQLVDTLEPKMPGLTRLYDNVVKAGGTGIEGELLEKRFKALTRAAGNWNRQHQKKGIKGFIAKLTRVPSKKGTHSHLIILDGLDQSNLPLINHKRILETLLQSVEGGNSPLRFIVSTRSDPSLDKFFQGHPIVRRLGLEESVAPLVPKYLRRGLDAIRDNCDGLPEIWPSSEDLEALDRLVDGQLGCASDILRYLGDAYTNGRPCDSPQILLERLLRRGQAMRNGQGNDDHTLYISPTPQLDHDYTEILKYVWAFDPVPQLLPAILCLQQAGERSSRGLIDTILGVPKGGKDLPMAGPIHSMLRIPKRKDPNQDITILRRSCIDFLNDPARSKQYFINRQESHSLLLQLWFERLAQITFERYNEEPEIIAQLWHRWAYFCVAYPGTPTKEVIALYNALDLTTLFNTAFSFLWSGRRDFFCSPFLGVKTLAGWLETHVAEEGVQPLVEYFKSAAQTNVYVSLSRRDGAPVAEQHTELSECFVDILVLGMAGCKHKCTRTDALINRAKAYFEKSSEFEMSVVGVGRRPKYNGDFHPHAVIIGKESFVRVAKNLMGADDVPASSEGLPGRFLNVLGSSLLSLCGNEPSLLPACERLTGMLVNAFSKNYRDEVVGCLRNVRGWLELFPQSDVRRFSGLSGLDEKIKTLLMPPPSKSGESPFPPPSPNLHAHR
ncbi:hypothetical protein AAF712_013749 [Marasmius tenuissimus]|uniref:Nephrocystin 3-like N-terminal domain-containing protein n=1 Tax=Marasmius tenuissimus TaxID=585030 RepID=A0ABR2ZDY8_9AGAR